MPQHKGFEPFMRIWVLSVRVRYKGTLSANYDCADTKCVFFGDEQSYLNYKTFIATGQLSSSPRHIELATDIGLANWYNEKVWILTQLQNIFVNGFFDKHLAP
jgi:hypothetical protein